MKLESTFLKISKETGTVELLMDSINISRSIASTVVDKRENLCFIGELLCVVFGSSPEFNPNGP